MKLTGSYDSIIGPNAALYIPRKDQSCNLIQIADLIFSLVRSHVLKPLGYGFKPETFHYGISIHQAMHSHKAR